MPNFPKLIFVSLLIFLSAISIAAQATISALVVSVSDPLGNVVTAVEVSLIGDDKTKRVTKTSDNGSAEFRRLAGGKYQISILVEGFKEYRSEQITLQPGETRKLEISLELAVIETKVDVDQNDGLDMNNSGATRDLARDQIETLPDDPDELKRVLQTIAGPTITGEEMPITVNGVPGATLPTKENIKLVRINRNVFSAQYENTFGGGIEIYTNSDVKKLSGWIHLNFADSRFNATDPFIQRRLPSQTRTIAYGFGGPLGKKTSYSFYSQHSENDASSVVNAVILDQNLRIVDFRQSHETPRVSDYLNFAVTSDPNKKHKVFINYNFWKNRGRFSDIGGFALLSRANTTRGSEHSFAFSDTYIINPDFVNVTRFSGRISNNATVGGLTDPSINVSEAFLGGGSQMDRASSSSRYEFYNDTTRKIGKFSVGFGIMLRGQKLGEVSRSNFGGTYTFTGRIAPVLDSNNIPVRDPSGNIVTAQISSVESYRRTILLTQLGYSRSEIRALGGGADQFTIAGGEPEIGVGQLDYAIYQQNSYGISETLGLSFGVRYENQTNIKSRTNLAPRFGVIWSPKAKDKQKPISTLPRITVGLGMFYSRFAVNNIMSERQANAPGRVFYFITDPLILDRFPAVPSIGELQQSAALRSLRLIDEEIQTPRQNLLNINVFKRLWHDIGMNFSYSHSGGYRQVLTRNINAPLAGAGVTVYPFGNSRNIYETRSEGNSRSNRFSISMNFPQWKIKGKPTYFSLFYGYAKIRNNIITGSSSPIDPYDFGGEWGPAITDGVHFVQGYFSLTFPHLISLRGDFGVRTGSRFNIITGRDTNRDGLYAERPAFAADSTKSGVVQTPYGLLDPNPAPGDRLIPRNHGVGPGGGELNLYISKSFGFNKDKANKNAPKQRLSFGVNLNNVLNINNKGNPIGNMSSPNFLRTVSSSTFNGESWPSNPRRLSFSTSFSF